MGSVSIARARSQRSHFATDVGRMRCKAEVNSGTLEVDAAALWDFSAKSTISATCPLLRLVLRAADKSQIYLRVICTLGWTIDS